MELAFRVNVVMERVLRWRLEEFPMVRGYSHNRVVDVFFGAVDKVDTRNLVQMRSDGQKRLSELEASGGSDGHRRTPEFVAGGDSWSWRPEDALMVEKPRELRAERTLMVRGGP